MRKGCDGEEEEVKEEKNTSLAAKGALAHHLQNLLERRTLVPIVKIGVNYHCASQLPERQLTGTPTAHKGEKKLTLK